MIHLTVRQPGKPDRRIEVQESSVLIGRHENSDVVLDEAFISKHHLRILSGLVVIDQKSRNGSYLEGQRLDSPTLIQNGDVLHLGKENMTLEVSYEESDVAQPGTLSQGDSEARSPSGIEAGEPAEALAAALRAREAEIKQLKARLQELEG